jgi:DeoR/GlpR family transcriptional regulator of sugar metabolism
VESPVQGGARARRHALILRYVAERKDVTLTELADQFGVSQMTVYRDVEHLERMAAVRRVPGGITSQPSTVFESNLQYRQTIQVEEKQAIARAAVKLVEPGMSIMLDDGTTIAPMLAELRHRAPLTVISGFTPVLDGLRGIDNIELIMLGGVYRQRHDCVVGVLSEDMIRNLRADLFFMSPSAIDRGEILHQEQEMVGVKRAMIASCERRVLLSDHSKLGRTATHRVAGIEEFDRVFVDERATAEQLQHLHSEDVAVTIVEL